MLIQSLDQFEPGFLPTRNSYDVQFMEEEELGSVFSKAADLFKSVTAKKGKGTKIGNFLRENSGALIQNGTTQVASKLLPKIRDQFTLTSLAPILPPAQQDWGQNTQTRVGTRLLPKMRDPFTLTSLAPILPPAQQELVQNAVQLQQSAPQYQLPAPPAQYAYQPAPRISEVAEKKDNTKMLLAIGAGVLAVATVGIILYNVNKNKAVAQQPYYANPYPVPVANLQPAHQALTGPGQKRSRKKTTANGKGN